MAVMIYPGRMSACHFLVIKSGTIKDSPAGKEHAAKRSNEERQLKNSRGKSRALTCGWAVHGRSSMLFG